MKKGKTKILFICLGNICRSPAAQGVMQQMVDDSNLDHLVEIDSAGVGSWHVGELADKRMRKQASLRGYELTHRARQFDSSMDFDRFDMIVTMDEENYHNITSMASSEEERQKVVRMSTFFNKFKGQQTVPDPYYGTITDFDLALDLIEDGCRGIIDSYVQNLHS